MQLSKEDRPVRALAKLGRNWDALSVIYLEVCMELGREFVGKENDAWTAANSIYDQMAVV